MKIARGRFSEDQSCPSTISELTDQDLFLSKEGVVVSLKENLSDLLAWLEEERGAEHGSLPEVQQAVGGSPFSECSPATSLSLGPRGMFQIGQLKHRLNKMEEGMQAGEEPVAETERATLRTGPKKEQVLELESGRTRC